MPEETIREEIGYKGKVGNQEYAQAMKILREIKKKCENSREKLPAARVQLNNGCIYKYRFDYAFDLINRGRGKLLEIIDFNNLPF